MGRTSKVKAKQLESTPINLNEFFGKETIEKVGELYERLQRQMMSGVETGISLRNIHNWNTAFGLTDKFDIGQRRKYSFTEFVWLKIVEKLREAGMNLLTIKSLKEELMEPIELKGILTKAKQAKNIIDSLDVPKEQKEQLLNLLTSPEYKSALDSVRINILDIMIVETIIKRIPLSIAVFLSGSFMPIDKTKEHLYSDEDKKRLLYETYINVSVTGIIHEFLKSDLSSVIVPQVGFFDTAENKLFELMRTGNYESITINFKDKKIKSLELKSNENIKDRIIDILNKGEFGEMIIKKHKGNIVKIENTVKLTL